MSAIKRNWFRMSTFALHPHDTIEIHPPATRFYARGWWAPDTDIYELDDGMAIIIDLAGVTREEVDILIEEKILSVSGTRRQPALRGKRSAHRLEIDYGNFLKRFRIPDDVDEERIEARYDNGFLHLRLPRLGRQRIEID